MHQLRGFVATTVFRWTLAIAGGFTVMALLLFAFIYWETASHERARIDHLIGQAAADLAAAPPGDTAMRLNEWLGTDLRDERYAGLFAPDGRQLVGNLPALPTGIVAGGPAQRVSLAGGDRDHDGDGPEDVWLLAVRLDDGRLLAVGYDIDELDEIRDIILHALSLGLLPTIALSLLIGTMLARRAQRRIAAVHEAIGRIMQGELAERLPVGAGGDDFARLAAAVNGMLGEIERLVGEIRAMGSSIAHDLRTPLTRLRTRLERNRYEARTPQSFRDATDRAIAAVDEALGVVAAVLRIGEIEHGRRQAAFAPLDVGTLMREAIELYEPLAEEKGVTLTLRRDHSARVLGDRDMLLEAVGNILDNAIKFTPAGTDIRVSVNSCGTDIRLLIADQGPGIPAAERERVLQRFYRMEKSRTVHGSGLGLSLVAAVIVLHGFRLRFADANPGCLIEIRCPAMPESGRPLPTVSASEDA